MSWEKVRFEELYLSPSRNGIYKSADSHGSGIKIVNMGEIFAYSFIGDQEMQRIALSKEEYERFGLQNGDLLFARRSLVESGAGKCSIVIGLNEPTTFESSIIRVRLDQDKCVPLFYQYWMRSHAGRTAIRALVSGTNVKGIRGTELKDIFVDYPDFATQARIASILKNYDDLIENNQRQIRLLEEAAQRLYKEWFVDLRFPGYENTPIVDGVPEGWEKQPLDKAIDFIPKMSLKKERTKQFVPMSALSVNSMVLNANEFTETNSNSGSKFKNNDTLLARITPCLENGKTGFVSGINSDEGAVGSTEFIVMRSKLINPYMVYLLARTEEFRNRAINSMTGSDGRQRAQVDKIKKALYLLPPRCIVDDFERIVKPIFEEIILKNSENNKLAEARDRLLPKLMSGEMEV
ncbi:MAG: restriction endonuclease subunit S [Thermoguttaceae bacterium]|nr:restriction endonuclease subunit S [Thermoguttaceae bacterium]